MSEERNVASGERRLERIRAERGMPVRRAPIAACALLGGALGAWAGDVHGRMLGVVREGLAASGSVAVPDGGATVREAIVSVGCAIAIPLACGAAGAAVGALAQTGFRLRAVGAAPWRVRVPGAADAGGAFARMAWAFAVMIAAGGAVALGWQRIAAIPALPLAAGLDAAAAVALDAVLAALGACAALAIADVAIARWRWERATMMTAAEAREEHRGADGDPETKQRRRHAARRIAGTVRGKELRGKAA